MAELRDCPVLQAGPVTSVAGVIDRLTEIRDCAGKVAPECGIVRFSDLYLTITRCIQEHLENGGFFADDAYLERLDVTFANRYFDALRAWAGGGTPPKVWKLFFEVPDNGEITAMQLAGGGVNAHINLDLAVAVVVTGRAKGDHDLECRRADYDKVNDVFAERMEDLLHRLEHPATPGAAGEEAAEPLSFMGRLMMRIVVRTRDHAWSDAHKLWRLPLRSPEWVARENLVDEWASRWGHLVLVDLPG